MIITKHAVKRGLERLYGVSNSTIRQEAWMEKMLNDMIKPSGNKFLEGTKYHAMIQDFDFHRAIIAVENGIHTVITITPITKG